MKAADWGLFVLTAGWGAWMCWGVVVMMGCSCASAPKPIHQLPAIADLTCTVVAVLAPTSPAVEHAQRVCDAWWAGRAEPREVLDAAERCRPELKKARWEAPGGIEPPHHQRVTGETVQSEHD